MTGKSPQQPSKKLKPSPSSKTPTTKPKAPKPPLTKSPSARLTNKKTPSKKKVSKPTPSVEPPSLTPPSSSEPHQQEDITPKFKSTEHLQSFVDGIQKRPVAIERTFVISKIDCYPLDKEGQESRNEVCIEVLDEIAQRKWESLCNLQVHVYETLVRQFYANMKIHDDEAEFSTMVLGKEISFAPPLLNTFFGTQFPHAMECFYDQNKDKEIPIKEMSDILCEGQAEWNVNPPVPEKVRYLEKSSLNPKAKLWCAFLLGILMPILHSNTLTKRRLWCLFALMKKEPIDVGLLMAKEMIEARATKNTSLAYGKIISILCYKAGVNVKRFHGSVGKGEINTSYFNQYIFGLPSKKHKPPLITPTSEPLSFRSIEPISEPRKNVEKSVESCQTDLRRIEEKLAKQNEYLQVIHSDVKKCLQLEPLLRAIGVKLGVDVDSLMSTTSPTSAIQNLEQPAMVDPISIEAINTERVKDDFSAHEPVMPEHAIEKQIGSDVILKSPVIDALVHDPVELVVEKSVEIEPSVKESVEPEDVEHTMSETITEKPREALDLLVETSLAAINLVQTRKRKRDGCDPELSPDPPAM